MTLPEEEFVKMSELIKAFIMNKDFFERGYLTSDENRVQFDYVEQMIGEEHAL